MAMFKDDVKVFEIHISNLSLVGLILKVVFEIENTLKNGNMAHFCQPKTTLQNQKNVDQFMSQRFTFDRIQSGRGLAAHLKPLQTSVNLHQSPTLQ